MISNAELLAGNCRWHRKNVVKDTMQKFADGGGDRLLGNAGWIKYGLWLVLAALMVSAGWAQPANDMFTNAITLSAVSGTVTGSNAGATLETNEPTYITLDDSASVDKSVWYVWTPAFTGPAEFDTFGSGFDTVLTVYTTGPLGLADPNLTLVAANDDYGSTNAAAEDTNNPYASQVYFNAQAGTTYHISVDGNYYPSTTDSGNYVLNWNSTNSGVTYVAGVPSGAFSFTSQVYPVSEQDAEARITVTRTGGYNGRVLVDYLVTNMTYQDTFTTNATQSSSWLVDLNANGATTYYTNTTTGTYNNTYQYYAYQNQVGGYYDYISAGALLAQTITGTYPYQFTPATTNFTVFNNTTTVGLYPAGAPPFDLADFPITSTVYSGPGNQTTIYQLPSTVISTVGVNYTNTFTTNTYGTNIVTTFPAGPNQINSTIYSYNVVAYSNYFSLSGLIVDGAVYTSSQIQSNVVFLVGTTNYTGPIYVTSTAAQTTNFASAYPVGAPPYTLTISVTSGATTNRTSAYTNTVSTTIIQSNSITATDPGGDTFDTNYFETNILAVLVNSNGTSYTTNYIFDTILYSNYTVIGGIVTDGELTTYTTNSVNVDLIYYTETNILYNQRPVTTFTTIVTNIPSLVDGLTYSQSGQLVFSNYQTSVDFEVPVYNYSGVGYLGITNPIYYLPGLLALAVTNVVLDPDESLALAPPTISPTGSNALLNILSTTFVTGGTVPPAGSVVNFEESHYTVDKDITRDCCDATVWVQRLGTDTAAAKVNYSIDENPPSGRYDNLFQLSAGSDYATPNSDFTPVSGTISWGNGNTALQAINIPILNNGLVEPNVDFLVYLYPNNQPGTAVLGEVSQCNVTINFDDEDNGQQPAGALDRSWNQDRVFNSVPPDLTYPGTSGGNGGQVYAVAEQPDGKTLVAGNFVSFDSNPYNRIVRLLANGFQDTTFLAAPNSGANDYISTMALQPDGRIVIGGNFTSFNGVNRHHIARLNTDGSVDTNFNPGLGANAIVWSLCVQTNGQIIIGGQFTSYNGTNVNEVARLNADGSLDNTFLAGSNDGIVNAVAVDALGRVLIGGTFNYVAGVNSGGIARLNALDGSLDSSFNPGIGTYDPITGTADQVDAIAIQPNGQILIGGSLTAYDLVSYNGILRLNQDATIDTSFDPGIGTYNSYTGVSDTIYAITLQPDGNILIGGDFQQFNQTRRVGIARLLSYGSLDTSFMDTAYNEFAGIPNQYFNENAVNPTVYPVSNTRNFVRTIGLESTTENVMIGGSFSTVGGGYYRNDVHNRSNIARLIGGSTPGPGNIQLSYNNYSVDKTAGTLFVSLVRTNGNLGAASIVFATNTPYNGAGVATPNDFILSTNYDTPTWTNIWSLNYTASFPIFPGVTGPNYATTPVGDANPYVYLSISNNLSSHGNLDADLTVSDPIGSVNLGGEYIVVGAALGNLTTSPLTIIDTGTLPGKLGFSATSYLVSENATNAVITVTRTGGSDGIVQVNYSTANGTATSANYIPVSGTLYFLGGVTSQTFNIPIINNGNVAQADKTVNISLYNATGGSQLGLSSSVLTIISSAYNPGQINFTQTGYGTNENAKTAWFTVTRLGGSTGTIQVTNTVTAGSAVNGVNFTGSTNVLFWNSGDVSTRTIGVPIYDDGVVTSNLTINLNLFGSVVSSKNNPAALGVYTNSTLVLTNVDQYGTVEFSASSYSVKEYAGSALVPVIRTGGLAQTIRVGYQTIDGTAINGQNYITNSGILTFTNGQVCQYISIPIINDGLVDGLLSFSLILTNATPTNSLGNPNLATVYIIDTETVDETPGTPDVTFYSSAGCNSNVYAMALQPNNQLIVGGDFTMANGVTREHIARLNYDGTLDSSFLLPYTTSGANGTIRAIDVMADGRIAIGGNFTTFNQVAMNYVAILNTDGSLDSTFNPGSGADNPVYAVAETFVNGESELLVAGAFANLNGTSYNGVGLLEADGNPDPSFNPGLGANATVYAMAVQSDGKIVVGGDFTSYNGATNFNHIGRLNPDGSVDHNFNAIGIGANASVRAITLQPDGKILIGGLFTNVNGVALNYVARLNTDGSVDPGFQPGVGANNPVFSIGVQTDSRIVLGGSFTSCNGVTRNDVTRLNPDGTVDPTINFGLGANNFVAAVVIQEGTIAEYPTNVPDEKIIIAGGFTSYNGQPFNRLVRLYGGAISGSGAFQFSSANYQVDEDGTNIIITVERTGGTSGTNENLSGDIYVPFATSDGSAVAGVNYGAVSTDLDFPEGEIVRYITIPVYDDGVVTSNLTANLTLSQPFTAGDIGNQPTALLTIINDDSAISFSSTTYQVPKNIVSGVAAINVLRQGAVYGTSTVLFNTTTTGTAAAGTDYTPVSNLLTFNPGVSNLTVTVPINNNGIPELNQTVGLQLTDITGSVPYDPTNAVLTIINTVNAPGQFEFSSTNYNVTEVGGGGYTTALITVIRTNGSSGIVSVTYNTFDGTALSGSKYIATNGNLTFGDGQTSQSFAVPIVNTATAEGTEYFSVALSNPTGNAGLAIPTNATVSIYNTNTGIAFLSSTNSFTEPSNSVPGTVNLTVLRLNNTNGVTTVYYSTTNGSAVAGTNFVGVTNAVLTFAPGISQTNITLTTLHDPQAGRSLDLDFTVGLSNPSAGAQLTAPTVTTVTDLDSDNQLYFYFATDSVFEDAGYEYLYVVCSNPGVEPVSVSYATSDGSALAGVDYIATSGTVTFTNGEFFNLIAVPIIPNNLVESNKQFSVNLFNPSSLAVLPGGTNFPSTETITIINTNTPYGLSFATPAPLSGDWGSATVDNSLSVPETGDPTIAGNPPTAPVWFRWTAPADGEVTLDTIGSLGTNGMKLDTVLGVYTGTSLNALNQVAVNDDLYPYVPQLSVGQYNLDAQNIYNPASTLIPLSLTNFGIIYPPLTSVEADAYQPYGGPSGLRFNAKAGVTYLIAADTKYFSYYYQGYPYLGLQYAFNATGPITLNWAYHPSGVFRFATERMDLTGLNTSNGIPPLLYECAETESSERLVGPINANQYDTTHGSYYDPNVYGMLVTVTRVGGSSGRVTVDYATENIDPSVLTNGDIPAVAENFNPTNLTVATYDYIPVSGTLTFDDFEMSKTIYIPIIDDLGLPRPNRDFNVVLSNPQLDPLETGDVSAPRVDPVFGSALCRILDCDTDPLEGGATQVVTTNLIFGTTNVIYTTNTVLNLTPTNSVFNFSKANYRVPRDISQWSAGTPVTVYVNRTGGDLNTAYTLHYRIDGDFLDNGSGDDVNNEFPLQPGSDYAVPTPAGADGIAGITSDFAGVGGDSGTITFAAKKDISQPIHFTVADNNLPEFNKDIHITLFAEDKDGNPYQVGMVAECNVTILFDDLAPPAGSVDQFYNQDFAADYVSASKGFLNGSTVAVPGTELDSEVYSVAVLPNNGITAGNQSLIAGAFTTYEDQNNTYTVNGLARLNYDGTLDTTFNPGSGVNVYPGGQFIHVVQLTAANQILIAGDFDSYNGIQRNCLARLNPDGSIDTTFNPGSGANGTVWAMAQQANGQVIIGGDFTAYNNTPALHIARINTDGTLDTTFNGGTNLNGSVYAVSVENDNNAVVVGGAFKSVGGRGGQSYICRLNTDGSLDTTFNTITGPNAPVRTLVLEPDNEVLAGGDFTQVAGQTDNHIVLFNINGSLDSSFNAGSGTDGTVYNLNYYGSTTYNTTIVTNTVTGIITTNTTVSTTNSIYVGGAFTTFNGTRRAGFARLYADGSVDTTFLDTAYNQFAGLPRIFFGDAPGTVYSSGVQDDGNILIVGSFQTVGGGAADKNCLNSLDDERVITESFADPYLWVSEGGSTIEPKSRDGVRVHSDVARLVGGATPGPGNIGMVYPSYTVNKTQASEPITLIRTNGTLGYASANFTVVPGLARSGSDYTYDGLAPVYPIEWEYFGPSRMHSDGLYGGNGLMLDPFGRLWKFGTTGPSSININIINDKAVAGNLDATLQLANPAGVDQFYLGGENIPVGVALGESVAPLTLVDNSHQDGVFGFASSSYTATGSSISVGLQRTNSSIGTVEVFYETLTNGSTAVAGTDYRATNGLVIFNPSQTISSFPVTILENSYISSTEKTVNLELNKIQDLSSGNASLGQTNAVIRIINPNYQGYLGFSAAAYSTNLNAGAISFTINRTVGSKGTLTIQYATTNGTALNGVDYVGTTNTLLWNNGDVTPRTVSIPLLASSAVGSAKQFGAYLFNPTLNYTNWPSLMGVISNTTLTINNNNSFGVFQFSAPQYLVNEDGGYATITVTRTGSALGTATVAYSTQDGAAVAGVNYVPVTNVLTFGPGQLSCSFNVTILPQNTQTLPPSAFFFNVALSNPNPVPGAGLGSLTNSTVNIVASAAYNQPPGNLDPTFDPAVNFNGNVLSLALQSNGQIVAGGVFTSVDGANLNHVARLNTDGTLDTSFMYDLAGANDDVNAVLSQTDDRILIGGAFGAVNGSVFNHVARLMTDGTVDTSFQPGSGADNAVYALAETFQNGSRELYVGGAFSAFDGFLSPGIVRLNNYGSVDPSFATGLGANGAVYAVAAYPTNAVYNNGGVLVGGTFTNFENVVVGNLVRLNLNGSVDTNFSLNLLANNTVRAIAIQSDGKILIGGDFTNVDGQTANHLARLTTNGLLDVSFATNLLSGFNGTVDAIAIQPDNRIAVSGQFNNANGVNRNDITRLLPNGSVDTTINFGDGANGAVDTLLIQPTNDFLVIGGAFTEFEDQPLQYIARLNGGSEVGSGQFIFNMASYQIDENGGFATITIVRTGGSSGTNSVTFSTSDLTAANGINYQGSTNILTFVPGQVFQTIYIPVMNDGNVDPNLIVNLTLSNPTSPAGLGDQATAQLTIINDNAGVSFSAANYSVPKNTVNGVANIDLIRVGTTSGACTVNFSTVTNGTAIAGVDFYPTNVAVVFNPGDTQEVVQVQIIDNAIPEGQRTLGLSLTNATGVTLAGQTNAVLTIIDTVDAPGQLYFATNSYTVLKANGNAYLTVLRTNGYTGNISVGYTTVAGTASPGLNYLTSSGTLSLNDGVASGQIAIPLVDNSLVQGTVNFSVYLYNPSGGATLIAPTNTTVNIVDHNEGVDFEYSTNYTIESSGAAVVFVQRVGATNDGFTVNYNTYSITAAPNVNYTPVSGTLTFQPGQSLEAISVPVIYDPAVTGDLLFGVRLLNSTGGVDVVAPTNSIVVIHDADAGLSFTNANTSVLKNAGSVTLAVVCSNPAVEPIVVDSNTVPLEVNYYTTNLSATAGIDYTAVNGTLVFTNGIGTNFITVPIINSGVLGSNLTFNVVLASPTSPGQLIAPSTETVNIINVNSGLEFSSPTYTVLKTGVQATINVIRTGYAGNAVSVNYTTTNGTAVGGINYLPEAGTLYFTNGQSSSSFSVPIISSTLVQPDLTVLLQLSDATNATLVYPSFATLTIIDLTGSFVVPSGAVLVTNQLPTNTIAGSAYTGEPYALTYTHGSFNGFPGIIYPGLTNTLNFAFRASSGTNVGNLIATLLPTNGITQPSGTQDYGPLVVGGPSVSRPFTFTASGTNGQLIVATFSLVDGSKSIGTNTFTFTLGTWTAVYSNSAPIVINDMTQSSVYPAPASPYPSIINVSGLGGSVLKSVVILTNLSHSEPGAIQALVVAPDQQNTVIMAGAGAGNNINNKTLIFDDAVADGVTNRLTQYGTITNGIYRSTQYANPVFH